MRQSAPLVVVALLTAACTSGSAPPTTPETTPTTVATTVPATSTAPSTTTSPPPSSTTLPPVDEPWPWQTSTVELPSAVEGITALVAGEPGRVVAGWQQTAGDGLWFSSGSGWSGAPLTEILGVERSEAPTVTELLWWQGRFWAFLMGDLTTAAGRFSALVSDDGREWRLERLGPESGAALPHRWATPESPPWPGTSAVADVAVTDEELVAVGWTTLADAAVPMMWRSADGDKWTASALPTTGEYPEWAAAIAAGPNGYLVHTAGPFYFGRSLHHSVDGLAWTDVSLTDTDVAAIAAADDGFVVATTDSGSSPFGLLSLSETRWEEVPAPSGGMARDVVSTPWGWVALTAADDAQTVWSLDPGGDTWVPRLRLDGQDRGVSLSVDAAGLHVETGSNTGILTIHSMPFTYSVVLVADDDVLNVRDGVMGEIHSTLPPTASGIVATGAARPDESGAWWEIASPTLGWVNSRFLVLEVDDAHFAASPVPARLLDELVAILETGSGTIDHLLGPHGISVHHWHATVRWVKGSDPLGDPTPHEWPNWAGEPPFERATFAEQIVEPLVAAYRHPARLIEVDKPIKGPSAAPPYLPSELSGLHYLAVSQPGTDPTASGLDWRTWYVYYSWTRPAGWRIAGLSFDEWTP